MGKKDTVTVQYFEDDARYADLLNAALFKGTQIIKPEDVKEKDTRMSGVAGHFKKIRKKVFVQKYRDCVRRIVLGIGVVVIGLEHQTKVHYAMPVRIMLEDALEYDRQLRKIQKRHKKKRDLVTSEEYLSGFSRNEKIMPTITIIIYYGDEWDGARKLSDLLEIGHLPAEVQKLVNDYPIYVLEVRKFKDIDLFQTDLREVFGILQRSEDKRMMLEFAEANQEKMSQMDEDAYELVAVLTGSETLLEQKELYKNEGGLDMCRAFEEMIADGMRQKTEIIAKRMIESGMSRELIINICEVTSEQADEWFRECANSKKSA